MVTSEVLQVRDRLHHLQQELQQLLSGRSADISSVALDVQVFVSEHARDLPPEQSRHILGQLQCLQGSFHQAVGHVHARADALVIQQERERAEWEQERERQRAREREVCGCRGVLLPVRPKDGAVEHSVVSRPRLGQAQEKHWFAAKNLSLEHFIK